MEQACICLSKRGYGKKNGNSRHMANGKQVQRNLRSNWCVWETYWAQAQNSSRLSLRDNQERELGLDHGRH